MRAEMGKDPTRAPQSQLNLPPGFRFYPTDEELVVHYLCKKAACEPFAVPIIAEVELYKFNPWDLPERALFGEKEWYFFSPRDRKYPNGSRPNRAAGTGYWKATGTDKPISTMGGTKKVGVKKALVFYKGKAPKGIKTNWIMHEYRLADCSGARLSAKRKGSLRLDDWVLCRIYKKSSSVAALMKTASNTPVDIKVEQSESSCLDDVLATLSELDDPMNGVRPADVEVEGTHTDMQLGAMETKSSLGNHSQEAASHYSDMRAYMKELQEKPGMANQVSHGGMKYADVNYYARQNAAAANPEMNYYARQNMVAATPEMNYYARQNAVATPESNTTSSRQHSPLESYSTSGLQQEEEDLTVESTFNSLASLPLTQLLNTQNLAFSNSPFGLDLGLPSPCSMLASGGSTFGGGSLIDPDNYPFQTSQWGWDPTRVNYSS